MSGTPVPSARYSCSQRLVLLFPVPGILVPNRHPPHFPFFSIFKAGKVSHTCMVKGGTDVLVCPTDDLFRERTRGSVPAELPSGLLTRPHIHVFHLIIYRQPPARGHIPLQSQRSCPESALRGKSVGCCQCCHVMRCCRWLAKRHLCGVLKMTATKNRNTAGDVTHQRICP